jgi:hypothetical protein
VSGKLAVRERRLLRKLKALTPPPALAPVYARFLKNVETMARGLGAGKLGAVTVAARENRPLVARLHAPACGVP